MNCVNGNGKEKRNERERMKKRWGENSKEKKKRKHHTIISPHSEGEKQGGRMRNSGDTEDEGKSTNDTEYICG